MKTCCICKIEKSLSEFYFRQGKTKLLYAFCCKSCHKDRVRTHYIQNAQTYKEAARAARLRMRAFVISQKQKPCVDCGVQYPHYVMDFDHLDRNTKLFTIAQWNNQNKALVLAEIEKCELVCANCHRIRTHTRGHNKPKQGVL